MGKIIEDNDSEDSYTRNSEQEIKTQANSSWKHWRVNASCDHLKADVLRMRTITEKKRTESLTPVKRQGAIIMLVSFELFVFTKWREASKVWQCNLKYKTSSLSRSTLSSSSIYFHTADGAVATSLLSTSQTHELKGSDVAWRGTEWRAVALDTVGGQLMAASSTETTDRVQGPLLSYCAYFIQDHARRWVGITLPHCQGIDVEKRF